MGELMLVFLSFVGLAIILFLRQPECIVTLDKDPSNPSEDYVVVLQGPVGNAGIGSTIVVQNEWEEEDFQLRRGDYVIVMRNPNPPEDDDEENH